MNTARPEANWIARYFIDPPDPRDLEAAKLKLAFGGGGLALALLMLVAGTGGISFLGFVGCIVGAVVTVKGFEAKRLYDFAYARAFPRPMDEDIDQILAMDTLSIMNRALPQLGLTTSDLVAPRGVSGPAGATFDDLLVKHTGSGPDQPGASQMLVFGPAFPCNLAIGFDGKKRYSRYEFMVICPTNYHLAVYRCELNLYTGGLQSERTYEFHYADVVAVRTLSRPLRGSMGIPIQPRPSQQHIFMRLDTMQTMEIVVASGDRASITMGVSSAADVTVDSSDINAPLEFRQVLQRVRQMLREKKGGTHSSEDVY